MYRAPTLQAELTALACAAALLWMPFALTPTAYAGADPAFTFYGYGEIVPDPNPAIVNETTHISVTVHNLGNEEATNVQVKLSFNDWGVTFQGWQEIGVVTVPSIPAGGAAVAEYEYVFENRAHTCLEALIVSADENDDPNNDRGQINMEVVNAGESFQFYVPIVNNGREDLALLVHGECDRQDPTGAVAGRCRVDAGNNGMVLVPAGGEVLIPVQVEFFPDTRRGTPMEVDVNAVDIFGGERNHVRLRVIYNTPRGLMEDCLAALDALPPLPSPGQGKKSNGLGKKIDEIASHIEKALAAEHWVGESRLRPHPHVVQAVYGQTAVAVQQLLTLIESKDLDIAWKKQLNRCVYGLTDATRILLQTAIQDADGDLEAETLLLESDALRLAGDDAGAIRKRWRGHVTVLK